MTRDPDPASPFITFSLDDAQGRPQLYECLPHKGGQGLPIAYALIGVGAEPIARVLSSVLQLALDGGGDGQAGERGLLDGVDVEGHDEEAPAGGAAGKLGDLLDLDLAKLAGAVDFAALGGDIRRAVATGDLPKLTRAILAQTMREGQKLSDPLVFDTAYARNYGELLRAVGEVIKINGFLPLPGI